MNRAHLKTPLLFVSLLAAANLWGNVFIVEVKGDVRIRRTLGGEWELADKATQLGQDDLVFVGNGSNLTLSDDRAKSHYDVAVQDPPLMFRVSNRVFKKVSWSPSMGGPVPEEALGLRQAWRRLFGGRSELNISGELGESGIVWNAPRPNGVIPARTLPIKVYLSWKDAQPGKGYRLKLGSKVIAHTSQHFHTVTLSRFGTYPFLVESEDGRSVSSLSRLQVVEAHAPIAKLSEVKPQLYQDTYVSGAALSAELALALGGEGKTPRRLFLIPGR